MTDKERSAAELRKVFGSNLRRLARTYPSVSALCRQLGINRTQFNRYLSGESFPRPDVLDQICRFFEVDARILLRPLDQIAADNSASVFDTFDHIKRSNAQAELPDGFFHVNSTSSDPAFARLIFARRVGPCLLLRCYASPVAPVSEPKFTREIRGFATHSGQNIYALMARLGGRDHQMLIVSGSDSADEIWAGHVLELADFSAAQQISRPVELRFLGTDWRSALRSIRLSRPNSAPEAQPGALPKAETV